MMEKLNRFLGLAPLASEHGHQVDHLIGYLHGLMFVLYGGWLLYFCYCLYRFRADRNPTASYFGTRSFVPLALILVLFALEIFDLVGVALPFWSWNADKYPKESESTVIKVAAQQFAWNVMYPGADQQFGRQDMKYVSDKDPFGRDLSDPLAKDNVVTLNEVHVVKDKPVIIYVSSKDVIHSFKVFPMRINQDAIPGLSVPIHFTPTVLGSYQISCAQLCGNGHAAMTGGRLIVQEQRDFDAWMRAKTGTTAAAYE
jgi:cytochrome c oxidase subunit 2